MDLTPGTKLGPYEITSLIGKGGMGEVYKARDPRLNRDVAIKVSKEQFSERFEREARAVAALNHANICTLYDIGPNYLVMEFVEGAPLTALIKQGAVPFEEALRLARQIADALAEAHDKRITHRDLKPGNIMLKPDGNLKVLDFGLAKLASNRDREEADATVTLGATQAGAILGTPAYMSPEQARGKDIDTRADIWAFGVVFYELLTGERMFTGEDISEVLAKVIRDEPPLDAVPAQFRRLLKKCLEKDPKKRLRDIGDVWELLAIPATSSSPARNGGRRIPYIAATVATIALAALTAIHFRETPPEERVVRAAILPPPGTTFDFTSGQALPAISPDGRRIAFGARNKDGKSPLWIRPINSLAAQPLAGTEGASFPFWSPDSRFIGFFADGKLKKIDTQGGPPVTLAEAASGRGGSWSPQGVILFGPTGNGRPLLRVSEAGGAVSPATTLDEAHQETVHKFPWFLPDGRHFLYEAQGGKPETIRLASIDASDGRPSVLVEDVGSNAVYANGYLLYLREQTLMAQPFDLQRLATAGEAVPLAEQVQTVLTSGKAGFFSVSTSGLLVYLTGQAVGREQLTWFDRTGKRLGTLGEPSAISIIELSPDRKRLGVTLNEGGGLDVWIYDVMRGIRGRFTFDPAEDRGSTWSPDGRSIIFDSRRKGHVDIYRRPSDASSAEELLYADGNDKFSTSWSPDGKFLLYTGAGPKTATDVWVLPLTPERASPQAEAAKPFAFVQTAFNDQNGKFSPDGHWVAYSSGESGRLQVFVAPFPGPGGKQQISIDGGDFPRWRSDGREIFYVSLDQRLMAAEVTARGASIQVGQVRPLLGPVQFNRRGYVYDISADGQQVLLALPPDQTAAEPLTLVENWSAALKK